MGACLPHSSRRVVVDNLRNISDLRLEYLWDCLLLVALTQFDWPRTKLVFCWRSEHRQYGRPFVQSAFWISEIVAVIRWEATKAAGRRVLLAPRGYLRPRKADMKGTTYCLVSLRIVFLQRRPVLMRNCSSARNGVIDQRSTSRLLFCERRMASASDNSPARDCGSSLTEPFLIQPRATL